MRATEKSALAMGEERCRAVGGPYESESDATAQVRDIYAAFHKRGVMRAKTLDRLIGVCHESGVMLGAYDRHVLKWLASQKPEVAQVVAGLIERAATAAHNEPAG